MKLHTTLKSMSVFQTTMNKLTFQLYKIFKYFFSGYFVDVNLDGFSTDGMVFGIGKMFDFHKGCYIAPVFNYAYDAETFNLGLGFGLKF